MFNIDEVVKFIKDSDDLTKKDIISKLYKVIIGNGYYTDDDYDSLQDDCDDLNKSIDEYEDEISDLKDKIEELESREIVFDQTNLYNLQKVELLTIIYNKYSLEELEKLIK